MKRYYGQILLISAVLVGAPRWAGAFLFADVADILKEAWIGQFLHWGAILSGFLMGPLEVLATAYIFNALRNMKPTSHRGEKEYPNYRYYGTAFFAFGLMVLTPVILAPYIVARMNGFTMPATLTTSFMEYLWSVAVTIAPIFIVGGVTFVDTSIMASARREEVAGSPENIQASLKKATHVEATPLSNPSSGDGSKPRISWDDLSVLEKWSIFDMPVQEVVAKYGVSSKTVYSSWRKKSKAFQDQELLRTRLDK